MTIQDEEVASGVIRRLELLLAEAKAGEIDGIAIALTRPDGTVARVTAHRGGLKLLAATVLLTRDIEKDLDESSFDERLFAS